MSNRKRKLTEDQKVNILVRRTEGASLRKIAEEFGVSAKTIMFVLNPEYYKTHKENNREYFKKVANAKKLENVDNNGSISHDTSISNVIVTVNNQYEDTN